MNGGRSAASTLWAEVSTNSKNEGSSHDGARMVGNKVYDCTVSRHDNPRDIQWCVHMAVQYPVHSVVDVPSEAGT